MIRDVGRRPPSGLDARALDRLASLAAVPADARDSITVPVPFTGELLGRLPRGIPQDVGAAVRRARAAQPAWAALPVRERARVLVRFHDAVLRRQVEALDLIQLESGKARQHAFEEVLDAAIVARHYGYHAARYLRPRRHKGAFPLLTATRELRHPVGVVGVVAPWNFPLNISITDALAALVAWNAVVLEPDRQSSFTALWAASLLYECGLPRDVLPVVTGLGPELGPPLVQAVDFVMFTGSTRTGRIVAAQAAERLIGASLELGGKNPMVVLDDAEADRVVEGFVRAASVGAGQVCVSIERLYVQARIYDRLVPRLVERTRAIRMGAALDWDAEMGSLTSERQLAAVEAHVADALEHGATLLAGGRRRPDLGPLFYEPTLLTDVTPEMRLFAEETFGPVVAIYRFDSDEDAVRAANAGTYGLNASVWSGDVRRALRVAERIRAGSVNINDGYAATWGSVAAPIGGMGESGLGRRHGAEGILGFTESQTIAVQRRLPVPLRSEAPPRRHARAMTRLLGILRRVPGLR